MGKNSAVWYAHFMMGYHEKHTIITELEKKSTLLCRLVYDQFGVVPSE